MERGGYVYILSCKSGSTIYVGVTSSLKWRIIEHKEKMYPNSFSSRYKLFRLVYYEYYDSIEEAINREKYLKGKRRSFKDHLIDSFNPSWRDLAKDLDDLDFIS